MLVDALKKILEPDCEVVGSVGDGMPLLNGLDAGRQLKHDIAGLKLIFLTMNEDPYLVGEALRAGASAYVLKRDAAFELTKAITEALKGRIYVTPCVSGGLANIA